MALRVPRGELDRRYSSDRATPASWTRARKELETAKVHFTTGEGERKAKNLARNPHCIVTTGYRDLKGLDMVVEGKAARVTTAPALRGLAEAYRRKYGRLFRYEVRDTGLYHQGTDDRILAYRLRAKKALGFGKGRKFSHTRWRL